MVLKTKKIKKLIIFFLPIAIIISQWISLKFINLSWSIYVLITIIALLNLKKIISNWRISVFSLIVLFWPLISFFLGFANTFNINLYISLITGLSCLLYIYILEDEDFNFFAKGCGFASIIFSIWALYEIKTGNYILFNNSAFLYRKNPFGLYYPGVAFTNTNDLAQFLVLMFPCQYLLLKNRKILNLIFTFLTFFVIFNTESKLSTISYVFILILGYLINMNSSKNNKKIKYIISGLFIILIAFFVDSYTGLFSNVFERLISINSSADYYIERSTIYSNLLYAAKQLPFGGFSTAYSIQAYPPHNLILYILCDFGWIISLLFILLIIYLSRKLYNKISGNNLFYSYIFCNLIFFVIMSSVSSCNEQRKAVWLFLAVCLRIINIKSDENLMEG